MAVQTERARRLFTVDEYDRMVEAGIFKPDDRLELIHGEIVEMSPIGERHAACVANLIRLLLLSIGDRAVVWPQNPVRIPMYSEPEPDVALLRRRSYMSAKPVPEDVLLIVEVADTSFSYDRTVKLRLYASAGIPEYWIVDANAECVDLYRTPSADGYPEVLRVSRDGALTLLAFPGVSFSVAEIFT